MRNLKTFKQLTEGTRFGLDTFYDLDKITSIELSGSIKEMSDPLRGFLYCGHFGNTMSDIKYLSVKILPMQVPFDGSNSDFNHYSYSTGVCDMMFNPHKLPKMISKYNIKLVDHPESVYNIYISTGEVDNPSIVSVEVKRSSPFFTNWGECYSKEDADKFTEHLIKMGRDVCVVEKPLGLYKVSHDDLHNLRVIR